MKLQGIVPAMVTPTTNDGEVDIQRTKAFARHLIDEGANGLLVAGSTGEGPLLTNTQRQTLIRATVEEAAGEVPVLAGVGAPSTAQSIAFAKEAEAAGAEGVAALPLHLIRVSQDELYGYFAAIAESVSIPTFLYNFPRLTSGQNISAEVAARLAKHANVVGIKDSSGDLPNTLSYIEACGPDFAVFTGNEGLLVKLLEAGGSGTVCSAANIIPRLLASIYRAYKEGDKQKALRLQEESPPLHEALLLGTFPAGVKAACELLGYPVGPPVLPVTPLNPTQRAELATVLDRIRAVPLT